MLMYGCECVSVCECVSGSVSESQCSQCSQCSEGIESIESVVECSEV